MACRFQTINNENSLSSRHFLWREAVGCFQKKKPCTLIFVHFLFLYTFMEESFSILEATKLTLAKLIVLCLVLSLQLNNPPQNMQGCLCHCQLMIIFVPLPFSLPLPGNVRLCLFTCPCRCPIVNKRLMASTLSRSEHKL